MRRSQFSIFLLAELTLIAAFLIAWIQYPSYDPPSWNVMQFPYSRMADIPGIYNANVSQPVFAQYDPPYVFANGPELFNVAHFDGWQTVYKKFMLFGLDALNEPIELVTLDSLSADAWTIKHYLAAEHIGKMDAIRTLKHLLTEYPPQELREKLGRIPWQLEFSHYLPLILTAVAGLTICIGRRLMRNRIHNAREQYVGP